MHFVVSQWRVRSSMVLRISNHIFQHNWYCSKVSSPSSRVLAKPIDSLSLPLNESIKVIQNPDITETPTSSQKKKTVLQDKNQWQPVLTDSSKLMKQYLMLSKIRLTSLVVITSLAGYAMAPAPIDPVTLICTATGTALLSCAANSINQFLEVPFDSQMSRTKNRVLVRKYLSPLHAIIFASSCAASGITILYVCVNGLTTALGICNLVLYTMIYTPLKRISILNTWVGSIVGAIPPLMGWAGCAGELGIGAWILAAILYAWQFPHFNALSWNLRPDYSRAGYRMMAVTNPGLCRRTALRYTGIILGLSLTAPALDVTHWWFAFTSAPFNAYFCYLAWKFYSKSDSGNSRKLFRFSLLHLPILMGMLLVSKKHWSWTENSDNVSSVTEEENNFMPSLNIDEELISDQEEKIGITAFNLKDAAPLDFYGCLLTLVVKLH